MELSKREQLAFREERTGLALSWKGNERLSRRSEVEGKIQMFLVVFSVCVEEHLLVAGGTE